METSTDFRRVGKLWHEDVSQDAFRWKCAELQLQLSKLHKTASPIVSDVETSNDALMLRLRRQPKGRAGGNRTIGTSKEGCLDAKHTILASMEVTLLGRPQSMIKESLSDFNATTTHIGREQRVKEAVTRRRITGHFIKDIISQ